MPGSRLTRREAARIIAATALLPALPIRATVPSLQPTNPRFSCMLWALEKLGTFDQRIEIVAAAGYQGIELVGEFQKWIPAEQKRILAKLKSLRLVIDSMSGVRAGFAVPADAEAFTTQFAEHLRYANELACPQVILLSGNRVAGLSTEAQHSAGVECLKRAADMAAKANVEIVIEPIDLIENPNIYMASVTEAFAIAEAVNAPNLRVLYDLYHEQRSFGNLLEKLERNVARIGLIHIADVPGRHEPGTGEIDYPNVYEKLAELGYSRWVAMEFYPTDDPIATLRRARLQAAAVFERKS